MFDLIYFSRDIRNDYLKQQKINEKQLRFIHDYGGLLNLPFHQLVWMRMRVRYITMYMYNYVYDK